VNSDATTLFLAVWAGASVLMAALWLVQRARTDATIVDAGWAAGLGGAAILFAAASSEAAPHRRWLVATMAGVWAVRLTLHLVADRVARRVEDGRYAKLRREWGSAAQRNFLVFFEAQAALVVLLSVTYLVAIRAPSDGFGPAEIAAAALWVVSLVGESVADRQLASFRADPSNRGKTCRAGLWRFSRHPNYFFEWLLWCSFVPLFVGSRWWYLGLVGPSVMLFLLVFVTGVPPAETRALESRGEEYRRYQRTTSVFFPWFPRGSE
jgi:steroid 5-alpha reductase family enzyme